MRKPPNRLPQNRVRPSVPYDPRFQPDVEQFKAFRQSFPAYSPLTDNFTLATYDSLPPLAVAWAQEFWGTAPTESGAVTLDLTFDPIPQGRTFVLRGVNINLAVISPDLDEMGTPLVFSPSATVDISGFAAGGQVGSGDDRTTPRFTVLNNGVADPFTSNLYLNNPTIAEHELTTFLIFSGGDVMSFRFDWLIQELEPIVGLDFVVSGSFVGDMLYSKGVDVRLEPVNTRSLPVEANQSEIVDQRAR